MSFFWFIIILGDKMEENNKSIKCDVKSCKYCDCKNCYCTKTEIKVSNCDNVCEKEATMCDSYKEK